MSIVTWTYQLVLDRGSWLYDQHSMHVTSIGFFNNFHTSLGLVLGSKVDFWSVCGKSIHDIEIDIFLLLNSYFLKYGWLFKTRTSTSLYTRVPAWYPPNIGRYSIVMKNVRSNYTKTFFWWEIWYPGQVVKISRTSLALLNLQNNRYPAILYGGKKKTENCPTLVFS